MPRRIQGTGLCAAVLALSFGAISCTAVLDGTAPTGSDPANPTGGTSSTGGTSGGGGSSASTGGIAPQTVPGYKAIHRLNRNEYNSTVGDVLFTALTPANGSWRDGEINGFDNVADQQFVDVDQYQRYFDAAGTLADDVINNAQFRTKFMACATPDAACVDATINKLGLYLFRRPLAANELANYKTVYTAATGQGENHDGSIKQVLRALLASAEFLYRMEFDANPTSTDKHPLTPYELATRLSYFLWSSAPDDGLLAAAADGSIAQDAGLKSSVGRLLGDGTRAERFTRNFYGQWLGARRVADHAVAADVYPKWNPALATAMAEEMYAYFDDFLKSDRSWLEFLTADENFVDGPLAELYGMQAPSASGMQKVTNTADKRVGFLGLGGFLAQSSLDRRTSPTLRGRWIMINLLCTHPPPPPENVPKIEASAGETDLSKGNVRAILETHRTNKTCANCHKLFDPYGIPLEQFDGIGAYRTTYGDGSQVLLDTELEDGSTVTGLDQLIPKLAADPRFTQCIADNMFGYSLGRVLIEAKDRDGLNTIQAQWNNGKDPLSVKRLIETVALGEGFRTRSGQPAQ